jgi:MFS family permease
MSANLVFQAPILVTLPLKVNSLVGIKQAPGSLALVAGIGAFVAMFGNPFFGRMSDRTSSRLGMRRPWMVIGVVGGTLGVAIVSFAPNIQVVLLGWCIAQLFFNAMLASLAAVLPDQVPVAQRGTVSGVLGICLPTRGGKWHVYREALRRTADRHISRPVRDGGILHPAFRGCAEGSAP